MPYVTIDAPAKINLRLKVVGRRSDGYHLLSMLNEKLHFADRLHIYADGSPKRYVEDFPVELRCLKAPSLEGESNLIVKAARALAMEYGLQTPLKIEIDKDIPIGAGLGGGSSDAAATLMALNKLWGLYKSPSELSKIGVTIGADVPFFLWKGPARVTGIGEQVDPAVDLPKLWVLLINPGFEISTRSVYESLGLELTHDIDGDRFPTLFNNLDDLSNIVENDLEEAVLKRHAAIDEIKNYLVERGAKIVFMSGSGSTVVGLFKSKRDRDLAVLGSSQSDWKFYSTENIWHRR